MSVSCTCFSRTFWEGRCEWCIANPEVLPPLDYQQMSRNMHIEFGRAFDKILTDAAEELGYQSGLQIRELEHNVEKEHS